MSTKDCHGDKCPERTEAQTTNDDGGRAVDVDRELLPDVVELTRVPELGEWYYLRGVGTVEVSMVDGNRVVCESPLGGEEYILPVSMLRYC